MKIVMPRIYLVNSKITSHISIDYHYFLASDNLDTFEPLIILVFIISQWHLMT